MPQPTAILPERETLQRKRHGLEIRARLLAEIRQFFLREGFLEVETPIRIRTPALEDHIEAEPSGGHWLRTSPELHMKRLLAAGYPRLYQMGPCFRQGEWGQRHRPEFTMLEWYRTPADYRDILEDTVALLRQAVAAIAGPGPLRFQNRDIDFAGDWEILSVAEAFRKHAGADLRQAMAAHRYEEILCTEVEPRLGTDRPTILIDYPAEMAALARRKPTDPTLAERWELYVGGLELANAYSELTDPAEQRQRFQACGELRQRDGRPIYPLDEAFLAALDHGLPPCGGIALGVDRLLMILADADSLDAILPFRHG